MVWAQGVGGNTRMRIGYDLPNGSVANSDDPVIDYSLGSPSGSLVITRQGTNVVASLDSFGRMTLNNSFDARNFINISDGVSPFPVRLRFGVNLTNGSVAFSTDPVIDYSLGSPSNSLVFTRQGTNVVAAFDQLGQLNLYNSLSARGTINISDGVSPFPVRLRFGVNLTNGSVANTDDPVIDYSLGSPSNSLVITRQGTNVVASFDALGNLTLRGSITGNGSGLTNLVLTAAATNAAVPSVTYNAAGVPNVWVPTNSAAGASSNLTLAILTNDLAFNTVYTNDTGAAMNVQQRVGLNLAALTDAASASFVAEDATGFRRVGRFAFGPGLATGTTNDVGGWVAAGFRYYLTNDSSGSASSAPIAGGSYRAYFTGNTLASPVTVVVYTNAWGNSYTIGNTNYFPVNTNTSAALAPLNILSPTVLLSTFPGSTMTVNPGVWLGDPDFFYQWQSNGIAVPSATLATFERGILTTNSWTCLVLASNALGTELLLSSPSLDPTYTKRYLLGNSADTGPDGGNLTNFGGVFTSSTWTADDGTNYLRIPTTGSYAYFTNDIWAGVSLVFNGLYVTNRAASGMRDTTSGAVLQLMMNRQGLISDTNYGITALVLKNEDVGLSTNMQWRTAAAAFDQQATNNFEWFIQLANTNQPIRLWINDVEVSLVRSNVLYDEMVFNNTAPFTIGSYYSTTPGLFWTNNSSLAGFDIRRPPPMFSRISTSIPFTNGLGGINTYRIPALKFNPVTGVLHAFAEARTNSTADDGIMGIFHRRSFPPYTEWGAVNIIRFDGRRNYDPCPFITTNGQLHVMWLNASDQDTPAELIAGTGTGEPQVPYISTSTTDGDTWGAAVDLSAAINIATNRYDLWGPNGATVIQEGPHAGRVVFYGTTVTSNSAPGRVESIRYSDDNAATWTLVRRDSSDVTNQIGGENVMVTFAGTNLVNVRRLTSARKSVTQSFDGGATWTTCTNLSLPFGAGVQAGLAVDGSNLWLSCNNTRGTATNPENRNNLTLFKGNISASGDITWGDWQAIDRLPTGYSCIEMLPGGKMAILYESGTAGGQYWDSFRLSVYEPTNKPNPGS